MDKWKYKLKLVPCHVCGPEPLAPGRIEYNCHQCNDMGEYWVVPARNGVKVIEVGKLASILPSLIVEEGYGEGLTTE